jgi:hypothetical protein
VVPSRPPQTLISSAKHAFHYKSSAGHNLPFIAMRKVFFTFSTVLVAVSAILMGVLGLNYGIDFQGGILLEVKTQGPADIANMRSTLNALDLGEIALQGFGAPDDVLIRVARQPGGDAEQQVAVEKVKQALGAEVEYRRVEVVGPQVTTNADCMASKPRCSPSFANLLRVDSFRMAVRGWHPSSRDSRRDQHARYLCPAAMGFNLTTNAAIQTIAGYSITTR